MSRIKNILQHTPRLYLSLLKIKRRNHWSKEWIVGSDTEVTIEGYQRSANSYFLSAFRLLQKRDLKIATHVHAPSQILRSIQLKVPTVVMIRNPLDAAKSLKALECQCNPEGMETILKKPLHRYLDEYTFFYSKILPQKDCLVVANFSEIVQTITPTIKRLNQHYKTQFIARDLNEVEKKEVFDEGGVHLSPNADRDLIKSTISKEIDATRTKSSLKKATAVYEAFVS